jgi:hypothetical protein
MSNNKQSMKLYTEEQVKQIQQAILCNHKDAIMDENYCLNVTTPIELPSDEEIEEKLNVAYGNGYEQGEMDFYKKMKGQGNEYADGYAEGYQRALELLKFQIVERLEKGGNNEQY